MAFDNSEGNYPSHLINTDQKNSAWRLQYIKAMYKDYKANLLNPLRYRHIQILKNRLYAEGKQDDNQYKAYFDTQQNPQFVNLNWQIVSPIPKIMNILSGYFSKFGESMVANAIDPISLDKQQQDKAELEVRLALKEFLDSLDKIQQVEPQQKFQPETPEELEILMKTNYKLEAEVMAEEIMEWFSYYLQWEENIKPQLLYDMMVDGFAGTWDYRDANGVIRSERIDMMDAIMGYSNRNDFSDMEEAGVIKRVSISQLREQAGDQITEQQYQNIAKAYQGKLDNPGMNSAIDWYRRDPVFGDFPYDKFTVEVFHAAFLSTNRPTWEKRTYNDPKDRLYGTTNLKEQPADWQPKQGKDTSEKIQKAITVYYKGSWVIDTDVIYNDDLGEDMRRDKLPGGKISADCKLPFRFFRPNQKSLVERMIPDEDGYMLGRLKLQNTLAQLPPMDVAIEVSGLENITIDGANWTPLKLLAAHRQTGVHLWRRGDNYGSGETSKPIEYFDNPMIQRIEGLINLCNWHVEQMKLLSGVNEAVDATLPNPKQPVATTQMAANATSNAVQPIYDGYLNLKSATYRAMLNRGQLQTIRGDVQGWFPVFGGAKMKYFKATSDLGMAEIGIRIEAQPTAQEKAQFEGRIQEALAQGNIDLEDSFAVEEVMDSSLKLARQLLEIRRAKKTRKAEQQQSDIVNQKTQGDQQSAAISNQSKLQLQQAEIQGKVVLMTTEYQLKAILDDKMTENKLKLAEAVHGNAVAENIIDAKAQQEFSPPEQTAQPQQAAATAVQSAQ